MYLIDLFFKIIKRITNEFYFKFIQSTLTKNKFFLREREMMVDDYGWDQINVIKIISLLFFFNKIDEMRNHKTQLQEKRDEMKNQLSSTL